jgi:hypothetical protein
MLELMRKARNTDLRMPVAISISEWVKLPLSDVLPFVSARDFLHIQRAIRAWEAPM